MALIGKFLKLKKKDPYFLALNAKYPILTIVFVYDGAPTMFTNIYKFKLNIKYLNSFLLTEPIIC